MGFWPVVLNVLKNSDIVLLIVDARMPELSKNKGIINKVERYGKRLFIVFNKTDLIGREDFKELEKENPTAFFVSGKEKKGINSLKKSLENKAENWTRPSLRIGIVGYPNVGKSTIINLLAPKAKAKVSKISGTTKKTQWIRIGKLRIMDSPGVIPSEDRKTKLGMISAKDPQKMIDPEKTAIRIIEFLREKNKKIIEDFYDIKGEDYYEIFLNIGKKKGYLLKKGEIDEKRTAIQIIKDWQEGKIKLY